MDFGGCVIVLTESPPALYVFVRFVKGFPDQSEKQLQVEDNISFDLSAPSENYCWVSRVFFKSKRGRGFNKA